MSGRWFLYGQFSPATTFFCCSSRKWGFWSPLEGSFYALKIKTVCWYQKIQVCTHQDLSMYVYAWLYMTIHDYVWLCMAIHNYIWEREIVREKERESRSNFKNFHMIEMLSNLSYFSTNLDFVYLCFPLITFVYLCSNDAFKRKFFACF